MGIKVLSYALAISLGLLAVAPPIDYSIPMMVNSFHWCFLVIAAGLMGFFSISKDLHICMKILAVYLFASCFFSQSPYLSFNAYILVAVTIYLFLAFKKADYGIILSVIAAAFWLEALLGVLQFFGKDVLLNFGAGIEWFKDAGVNDQIKKMIIAERVKTVFLGTVMQYMRFASLLACMAPFLILKSRWYIIPLVLVCVLSRSSSFALSLAVGTAVYLWLVMPKKWRFWAVGGCALAGAAYVYFWDWGSFHAIYTGGRLTIWKVILKTWCFDTTNALPPAPLSGPFNWQWFLFGHGQDTFITLFPIFKHDPNPFQQAHNDWLQIIWEFGLTGFVLISSYVLWLILRLYRLGLSRELSGLFCIGTNLFCAFPLRMTQTIWLLAAYVALCEQRIRRAQLANG